MIRCMLGVQLSLESDEGSGKPYVEHFEQKCGLHGISDGNAELRGKRVHEGVSGEGSARNNDGTDDAAWKDGVRDRNECDVCRQRKERVGRGDDADVMMMMQWQ